MQRLTAVLTVLLLAALLLAGCGPSTGGSAAPSDGSAAPSARASGTVSSTSPGPTAAALASGPAMDVRIVGTAPVLSRTDGPTGHDAVLPAATAVDADGSIVAFLVWFGQARGDQVVTVARSHDGRAWTVSPTPVYTDLGLSLSPPGPIPGAARRAPDGTWQLLGWGASAVNPRSYATWRATASTPEGPWTTDPAMPWVLRPGPVGAWDDETVAVASVLDDGAGLAMWYEGQRAGTSIRGSIGHASSPDGIAWTRWDDPATAAAGDPVLPQGACGPGTSAAVLQPRVWRHGAGYLMVFTGSDGTDVRDRVFGATSTDGIHWSCSGKVLLEQGDIPGSEGIHTIQGITLAGQPGLLVESLHDGGSELWLATITVGT